MWANLDWGIIIERNGKAPHLLILSFRLTSPKPSASSSESESSSSAFNVAVLYFRTWPSAPAIASLSMQRSLWCRSTESSPSYSETNDNFNLGWMKVTCVCHEIEAFKLAQNMKTCSEKKGLTVTCNSLEKKQK